MSSATALRTVLALAIVTAIGWLDYVTGPRWGFSLFYLAPIVVVGWRLGAIPALVVASAAGVAWLVADVVWYRDSLPSLWNGLTRLVVFLSLGLMTAALRRDRERLRALLEQEARVARTDALTGLVNARAFYERAADELARARRHARPLALVYLDLDNFKAVNDRFGHARGDALLQEIAAAMRANVRASDVVARLGGDELAILLPEVDRALAETIAGRLAGAVDGVATGYPDTGLGASVGVAWFATPPDEVETMVHAADEAMYRAKAAGKHAIIAVSA